MMRFYINLNITLNDRKIQAIKDLRQATGMGLLESKTFCETYLGTMYDDCYGGALICNAEQAAAIAALHFRKPSRDGMGQPNQPNFTIVDMKKIDHNGLDISNIVR
jgi:hypothetical protein